LWGSAAAGTRDLSWISRWLIILNPDPSDPKLSEKISRARPDLVIVDPDHSPDLSRLPEKTLRLAYLSVGEAETYRPYWTRISSAAFLVEENLDWEGNVRVDFRSPQWQRILLDEEIPRRLRAGYHGVMLDTLDAIPYLEKTFPERFAGLTDAVRTWLTEVRRRHPDMIIAANGTESLILSAPFADLYVTEGVFAAWDGERKKYRGTTPEEYAWKLTQIERALEARTLPVFNIEYASPDQKTLIRRAKKQSRKRKFKPFISTRELHQLNLETNGW